MILASLANAQEESPGNSGSEVSSADSFSGCTQDELTELSSQVAAAEELLLAARAELEAASTALEAIEISTDPETFVLRLQLLERVQAAWNQLELAQLNLARTNHSYVMCAAYREDQTGPSILTLIFGTPIACDEAEARVAGLQLAFDEAATKGKELAFELFRVSGDPNATEADIDAVVERVAVHSLKINSITEALEEAKARLAGCIAEGNLSTP